MNESIPDALLKVADVLHFLGRSRESNIIVLVSRWLRARGIENETVLWGAVQAAEADAGCGCTFGFRCAVHAEPQSTETPERGK